MREGTERKISRKSHLSWNPMVVDERGKIHKLARRGKSLLILSYAKHN